MFLHTQSHLHEGGESLQGCKKSLHGFCKHLPGVHQLRALRERGRREEGGRGRRGGEGERERRRGGEGEEEEEEEEGEEGE